MTDRKLLELAAKAAGMDVLPHPSSKYSPSLLFIHDGCNWNPLTDDGDALRLAVKLKLLVDGCSECARPLSDAIGWQTGDANDDPYAATRRAIVRAAAEIGRAKEKNGA